MTVGCQPHKTNILLLLPSPPIRPGLGLVSKYLFVHQHHGDSAGCLCTDYKSLLDVGGL